jgi:hypothetical protein
MGSAGAVIEHEVGPFAIVPMWVFDALIEAKQPEAMRLYIALHRWTSAEDRSCYPSRQTIAATCGVSTDTIDRYVKALQAVGALRVEARHEAGGRTSNLYTVIVSRPSRVDAATGTDAAEGSDTHAAGGSRVDAAQNQTHLEPETPPTPPTTPIAAAGGAAPRTPRSLRLVGSPELSAAFEAFWETYEHIGPRKKAWECWRKAVKRDEPDVILAGLRRWMDYWHSPGATAIKWPQGWLNADTWRDEPPPLTCERPSGRPRRAPQMLNGVEMIDGWVG